jgi:adenosylcobinamide amidohydrolase
VPGTGAGFDGLMHTLHRIEGSTLVITLRHPCRALSSAVLGGGFRLCRFVINHELPEALRVPGSFALERPAGYLRSVAATLGLKGPVVGLMTAVPMDRLVCLRREEQDLWVEAFITVGTTNALRVGERMSAGPHRTPGTVNIVLVTNASLSARAMVEAVQVATEAKAAAFADARVVSTATGTTATGTGTDVVVVVSGNARVTRYVGSHTSMGELLGRAVLDGVSHGLRRG